MLVDVDLTPAIRSRFVKNSKRKLYCHKDYLAKFPVETSDEIAIDATPTEQISAVVAADAATEETLENEARLTSKPKKEEVAVEELAT